MDRPAEVPVPDEDIQGVYVLYAQHVETLRAHGGNPAPVPTLEEFTPTWNSCDPETKTWIRERVSTPYEALMAQKRQAVAAVMMEIDQAATAPSPANG